MKSLALKEITLEGAPQATPYTELLKMCVKNPPKDGFDAEEMEKRMRLTKALREAEGKETLELEDADAAKLKEVVAAMRWGIMDEGIVEMLNAVKAL